MINEVHVEFVCQDDIYTSLKKWAVQNPHARLMLLVDSCPHCNHILFPCDAHERYRELSQFAPVGLHTHLFQLRHWQVENLTYNQQKRMIENGVQYLRECGIETVHFAPGNWKFNSDTIQACHVLGLTVFHWHENEENKETVANAKTEFRDMQFVSAVNRYTHDWTIHESAKKSLP